MGVVFVSIGLLESTAVAGSLERTWLEKLTSLQTHDVDDERETQARQSNLIED